MKSIIILICSAVILGSCYPLNSIENDESLSSSRGRILGGSIVRTNQPYHVGILVNKGLFAEYWCSGVLIKPKIGLTTAHCLYFSESAEIFVGSLDREDGKKYEISRYNWVLHENYNRDTHDNDIAMFWLPEPITLSPRTNIIKLGHADPDDIAIVSGWGYTFKGQTRQPTKLMYGIVKIITEEDCARFVNITENQLCTTATSHRASTYTGDTGAPLVFKERLVGLNSIARDNCFEGCPDVFTRICPLIDWINWTGGILEDNC